MLPINLILVYIGIAFLAYLATTAIIKLFKSTVIKHKELNAKHKKTLESLEALGYWLHCGYCDNTSVQLTEPNRLFLVYKASEKPYTTVVICSACELKSIQPLILEKSLME